MWQGQPTFIDSPQNVLKNQHFQPGPSLLLCKIKTSSLDPQYCFSEYTFFMSALLPVSVWLPLPCCACPQGLLFPFQPVAGTQVVPWPIHLSFHCLRSPTFFGDVRLGSPCGCFVFYLPSGPQGLRPLPPLGGVI